MSQASQEPFYGTVDTPRVCPLCNSSLFVLFIHFNDKFHMCENFKCEFPVGYEDLKFEKEDEDEASDEEDIKTNIFMMSPSVTGSSASRVWSDIDKIQNPHSDELAPEPKCFEIKESSSHGEQKRKKKESELMQNIRDIQKMNEVLREDSEKDNPVTKIKNKKWIKNLKNLQETSGMQLLRPEEVGLLRKEEPIIGLGELSIDISPASNTSMSNIRIQIHNKNAENETPDKEPTEPELPSIELASPNDTSTV